MISKELLSEVLGFDCIHLDKNTSLNPFGKDIVYKRQGKNSDRLSISSINIYEFEYKCLAWLNNKGYDVLCCALSNGKAWVQLCDYEDISLRNKLSHYIHGNSANEAILNSCQWILGQQNEN